MTKRYKIGFTRPALIRETVLTAHVYLESDNWENAREKIRRDNAFQTRTERSGVIMFDEIRKRLSLLNHDQIEVISDDFPQDVRHLVWIALCKQYPFIADFTLEVLLPAHQSRRHQIDHDDYGYFFNSKADWHPELEVVSDKTRSNARQALFQMMRQCDLLSETNQLIPQMVSAAVQNCTAESELDYIPGAIRL